MSTPAPHKSAATDIEHLARRIRSTLSIDPAATALTFEDVVLPWSFFSDAIDDLDTLLSSHPRARRIGVVLRNRPGSAGAVIATLGSGRQLIPLSPHLGDAGLASDITRLKPDVVIAEPQDWSRDAVLQAAAAIGAVAADAGADRAIRPRTTFWPATPAQLPAGEVAVLMMTSGTTGHPKRVELTFSQMLSSLRAAGSPIDEQPTDLRTGMAIMWASLAHISGLYFLIAHVIEGRSMALMEKFSVEPWVDLVRRHRPGFVRLAPAAMRMVLQADVDPETFASVRAIGSGSAPLPPELADAIESRFDTPVLGTYGATEFAGAIAGWSLRQKEKWGALKRGSVGRAHAGIELRVVDPETGVSVAPGTVGLLEARGSQLPCPPDEWLRTTDLAELDTDGFLFIRGRADGAINRGGFKIPPSVIEDALHEHPAVDEAAALGVPDPRLGEVPVVAVTLRTEVTEQELMDHLTARLTRYQVPVRLRIVPDMPRTPSMKISRPQVREHYFASETSTCTAD